MGRFAISMVAMLTASGCVSTQLKSFVGEPIEEAYFAYGDPEKIMVLEDGNKAYFAFIKDNKIDLNKARKIKEKSLIQMHNTIKEGIMQELIGYLAEQNDVKVKM